MSNVGENLDQGKMKLWGIVCEVEKITLLVNKQGNNMQNSAALEIQAEIPLIWIRENEMKREECGRTVERGICKEGGWWGKEHTSAFIRNNCKYGREG